MKETKTCLLFFLAALLFVGCAGSYKITNFERTRLIVDSTYDALPDAQALAFMEIYKEKVDSLMSPVVGHTAKSLAADKPESPLSNLLSDILVWASEAYGEQTDFGVYNIGGMRASLPKGAVTFGNVLEVAPFENKICFLTLKGSDVLELFRQIAVVGGEGLSGGVRMVITNKGELKSVKVNGEDVDEQRSYRIATIDYLSEGNDRMTAFKKHYNLVSPRESSNDMRYIISDYFRAYEAKGLLVDANVEGRVVVVNEE